MPLPFNRSAFGDCFALFDQAVASPRGVQRLFDDPGAAAAFRMRLYQARALDRKNNRLIYSAQPDHPMYGVSEFEQITIRIIEDPSRGKWLCRLEKVDYASMEVEELAASEGPQVEEIAGEEEVGELD